MHMNTYVLKPEYAYLLMRSASGISCKKIRFLKPSHFQLDFKNVMTQHFWNINNFSLEIVDNNNKKELLI